LGLFCGIFLLEFYLNLIGAWEFLLSLDGLDSVFFEDALLSEDDLAHIGDHSLLNLKVYLKLDIL
jgi:hypothetical protein